MVSNTSKYDRKILFFLLFTLSATANLFSQKQNNQWRFGYGGAINFNTTPPSFVPGSAKATGEGSASVADRNTGALLFYTDGVSVWNANNQLMPNGTGLLGGTPALLSSTTAAVIVPKPGSTRLYYIIAIDEQSSSNGITYSVVDMSLNGGLGAVVAGQKNIPLYQTNSEKLEVVPGNDGQSFWLVTRDGSGNSFASFKITSAGIQANPVISTIGSPQINGAGHIKINRQFNKLAIGVLNSSAMELFDFNNATGEVSNQISWGFSLSSPLIYGIEFSPDGKVLYISDLQTILQYDLTKTTPLAIQNSVYQVATGNNATLQLGPDNKIYVNAGSINVINCPNKLGAACGYQTNAIANQNGGGGYGLPKWVYYASDPPAPTKNGIIYSDSCLGNSTQFSIKDTPGILNISWNFDDPTTGAANTSTSFSPTHIFSALGTFNIKAIINYTCGTDTLKEVIITTNCSPPLITGIKLFGDTCNASSAINFQGIGTTSSPYFFWNFGDPASGVNDTTTITGASPNPNPAHIFSAPGTYTICASYQEPGLPVSQVCRTVKIGLCCLASSSTTNQSVCSTQLPYTWNGQSYNAAGTYTKTLINAAGCDSVATLVLTVKTSSASTTNQTICSNQLPYSWNAQLYNTAGTYTKTLVNAAGCDSIATLVLSVTDTLASTTSQSVCTNQLPFTWNGQLYNASGTYTKKLTGSSGCDSIATLILSVTDSLVSTTSQSVCTNQLPYTWNGQLYSSAGTYTKKFTSTAGCDSVATLVLTVNDTVSSITSQTVCANQLPYTWNGQPYNAAGTYTKKLTSAAGCDSTATLILSLINIGCDDIYFPTAISPGGNFNNRTFGALGNLQVVSNYSLSVYNRYGQLVFYTSNPFQKWDGRFKGNHTGNDAFVWFATYTVNGSIKKVQKGTLVVIR